MEQGISQKIIKNTIFNTIGHFWGVLVALFLTPYIIHRIGVERYGIWAIIGVLTGYLGLLDFGIGASFVKHIAEFYAKKNFQRINQIINTGFVFYSVFAAIVIPLSFFLVRAPLLAFFKIPQYLSDEALFVFLAGIVLFCVSNALSPFGAVQNGLQRMNISNKVAIAVSVPNILGTIFVLEKGYGLRGLMVNNAAMLVITSLVNIVIAFRILPELRFNPFLFSKEMLGKLFHFGYKLQVITLSSFAGSQTDKLLLIYFLGLGSVTYYQLGDAIIEKARGLSLLIVSALMPAVAELDAKSEAAKIKALYIRSLKYVVLIAMPLNVFLMINSRRIILTWMGQDLGNAVLSLQVLSVGAFVNTLTGPASVTLMGMGRPKHQMTLSLFHFFLSVSLSLVLVIKIGFVGVLIGTSLSYFITGGYFIHMVNKLLGVASVDMTRLLLRPLLACIAAAFVGYWLNRFADLAGFGPDRLVNFCILIRDGVIFGAVGVPVLWMTKYFDKEDILLFRNILSRTTNKINPGAL